MQPTPLIAITHRLIEQPAGLLAHDHTEGWMVLRVQPRDERTAVNALSAASIPHLGLRIVSLRRYSRQRSRRSERSFLPGHWFVRWPAGHHDLLDRLRPLASGVLPVPPGGGARFLRELRDFCRVVLADGMVVDQRPGTGEMVEVTAGTLAGCRGRVLAHDGQWHLLVELSLLGTTVATRIDAGCTRACADTELGRP